jgi:hypothetical protein
MATLSRGLQKGLQIVLAIAIVGLAYLLYVSITEPYEAVLRRQEVTRLTHERMNKVRTAMITFERRNGYFVHTLDSLADWIATDSLIMASADSIFGVGFSVDSLIFSPRTGNKFELAVNDTTDVRTYLLSDPDSDDFIGTLTEDITRLNAASWE